MKSYSHDVAGLVEFYGDRVTDIRGMAQIFDQIGLPELGDLLRRQAEANEQIAEWSQILVRPVPDLHQSPTEHRIWVAVYRLLRRQATVFCLHPQYWGGWHPKEDPDRYEEDRKIAQA